MYELVYRNDFSEFIYITENLSKILAELKEKHPAHFVQKKLFQFIEDTLNPSYKRKYREIESYIKSIGFEKTRIKFSPFFEEKEFEIVINVNSKNDIQKTVNDLVKIQKHIENIWDKV